MARSPSTTRRLLVTLALACAAGAASGEEPEASAPCPVDGAALSVLSNWGELWLCSDGAPLARFPVALGRRGLGKRQAGDDRTPRGVYRLGAPRASRQYGTFIPIAYPTAQQAALGYTGKAIGIHGPPRGLAAPHYPAADVDWTRGCIATGTDEHVEAIAAFVRLRKPRVIIIR